MFVNNSNFQEFWNYVSMRNFHNFHCINLENIVQNVQEKNYWNCICNLKTLTNSKKIKDKQKELNKVKIKAKKIKKLRRKWKYFSIFW